MNIVNPSKKYENTCNLVYSCQYHVIFCPKYRRPVLLGKIKDRLKEIIAQKQSEYNYNIIEIEILSDHVHLLISVNPKIGIHSVVTKIKGSSSRILREEFPELKSKLPTLWTNSKFISTVGSVSLEIIKKYIEEQKNK
jgi:putative transposase